MFVLMSPYDPRDSRLYPGMEVKGRKGRRGWSLRRLE